MYIIKIVIIQIFLFNWEIIICTHVSFQKPQIAFALWAHDIMILFEKPIFQIEL